MTTFDERERAFENLFVHDAEVRFRVQARRNRAVAAWAGERLGQDGAVAAAYRDDIVAAGVAGLDDAALARRIADDLSRAGHPTTAMEVEAEMGRQLVLAIDHERTG